jgi:hypothetical protein
MPSSFARSNELARTLPCHVRGCLSLRRGVQRFCNRHQLNLQRFGSPTGRLITFPELLPYRKLVDQFVKDNEDHPALLAAYASLDEMLQKNISYRQPKKLGIHDHASRIALRLRDLMDQGVDGRQIFRAAATAYAFSHYCPHIIDPLSIPARYLIARRVLSLAHFPDHNTPHAPRTTNSGRFLDPLGRSLLGLLRVVLIAMTESMTHAIDAERERHARYIELLTSNPFKQTTPLPQPRSRKSAAQRTLTQ